MQNRDLHPFIFFLECVAEPNRPFKSEYKYVVLPPAKMLTSMTNPMKHNTNDTLVGHMMPPRKVSKHVCKQAVAESVIDLTQDCSNDDVHVIEV